MQTFDVYLKKRLTEIDVIISQLAQRDIFSLYDYLYFICYLSELELLKTISIESGLTLNIFISDLEKKVYEYINNKICLITKTSLSCQITANGSMGIILSVDKVKAIKNDFINSKSVLEISVEPLDYYIAHLFDTVDFDIIMFTNQLEFLKKDFEKNNLEMYLFAKMTEILIGIIYPSESTMILSCEASTGMKHYRFVSEMDDFTVSEFDNMNLHELDFITIA